MTDYQIFNIWLDILLLSMHTKTTQDNLIDALEGRAFDEETARMVKEYMRDKILPVGGIECS